MKYWIITDTHYGHENVIEWCGRPKDWDTIFYKNICQALHGGDVLIHLGDVAWKNEIEHNEVFVSLVHNLGCKAQLVKGNHDKRTNTWYYERGWDCVCDTMLIKAFGKKILLSHTPQEDLGYFDINIHGHFHNTDHRNKDPELSKLLTDKHYLIKLEHDYKPYNLRKIVEKRKNA